MVEAGRRIKLPNCQGEKLSTRAMRIAILTGIDLYDFDPAVRGTYANTGKTYRDAFT